MNIIVIGGPTASGKSALGIDIAKEFNGLIINADSQQVYHNLQILTARPNAYELSQAEHVLYGHKDAQESYSVGTWAKEVVREIEKAKENNQMPIILGGTGFYLKTFIKGISKMPEIPSNVRNEILTYIKNVGNEQAHTLLKSLDPQASERIAINDSQRLGRALEIHQFTGKTMSEWWQENPPIPYLENANFIDYTLLPPREQLYESCNQRFTKMLQANAIEEVKSLLSKNIERSKTIMKTLGVPELIDYLEEKTSLEQATILAQQSTRKFAKRQITFFKNQLKDATQLKSLYTKDLAQSTIHDIKTKLL